MTTLDDLFDVGELFSLIDAGYVRRQYHPTEPLVILNYSEKAQYEKHWTDVTRQCRGLIARTDTREVVARPWPKFFNYGEIESAVTHPAMTTEPAEVTDKMDGSLGILYREPNSGELSIATRGSFTSDQAKHATEVLRARYARYEPCPEETVLFEIVYPENRIVLDYGATDDLVLLGSVDIDTGDTWGPSDFPRYDWPGPRAEILTCSTLAEALRLPPREKREGLVVRGLEPASW